MKRKSMPMLLALTAATLSTTAHAGLTLVQSSDLPAAWPTRSEGTLESSATTMASPTTGTVNQTVAPNSVFAQTFTLGSTITLDAFSVVGSGAAGVDFTLHLFQFDPSGGYVPASSGGYVPSTAFVNPTVDLLGGGSGLSFSTIGASANRILTFDLTGADEVTLNAGTTYTLELWNVDPTDSYFLSRGGETYAGGSIFQSPVDAAALSAESTVSRNNVATGTRDAAFATYAAAAPVPEPATLAALGLGAAALLRRRRKSA